MRAPPQRMMFSVEKNTCCHVTRLRPIDCGYVMFEKYCNAAAQQVMNCTLQKHRKQEPNQRVESRQLDVEML